MKNKEVEQLLERYLQDTASMEERQWVETHYVHLLGKEGGLADKKQLDRATRQLQSRIQQQTNIDLRKVHPKRSAPVWIRYAAAVLLFLLLGGGTYLAYKQYGRSIGVHTEMSDILPGGNRATLQIAGGQTVELSHKHQEVVTGDKLLYADGSEVLDQPLGDLESIITQLTLSTPKGGTYQVVLPDGTKVWLNAASELKYPSEFAGDKREVELSGEAYFSVMKDAARPFRVKTKGQHLEVLGTQFNIKAYSDEATVQSTLVEGSVRIALNESVSNPVILSPGQQARADGHSVQIAQVDLASVTAWKNGRFSFKDKSFDQVMRELGRWYNIEVAYQGAIPDVEFYGGAFRNHKLSTVLRLLESAGLEYKIEDRTLIVIDKTTSKKGGTR